MSGAWALEPDTYSRLQAAAALESSATAEQRAEFTAAARGQESPLVVAGDVASIKVEGLLTAKPDFLAWLLGMGNTTYSAIVESLASAAADPNVKRVELLVNSPGGQVSGLFDALSALENFQKPISTRASFAASAAYAIASRGGKITATGPSATFGSIGVAASFRVSDDVVDVTSTHAPNKRPNVTTEEGKAVVRKELDDIHALFVDQIAKGRNTTAARVNADFGRGGVVLAAEAKRLGMVDAVSGSSGRARGSASLEIGLKLGLTAEPGSQLEACEQMLAGIDASETQLQRAERLLAAEQPPAPPTKQLAEQVADRVDFLMGRGPKKPAPKNELPLAAARAAAQLQSLFQPRKAP